MDKCLDCGKKCQQKCDTPIIDVCDECKKKVELFVYVHSKVCWDCYVKISNQMYQAYLDSVKRNAEIRAKMQEKINDRRFTD